MPSTPARALAARSRRVPLRRERIVAAGVRLALTEGFGTLTMSRLAAELSVGEMTLYWHFPNKQALLETIADAMLADVRVPSSAAVAEERAARIAEAFRVLVTNHPDLGAFLCSRGPVFATPHGFRLADASMGIYLDTGLSDEDAARRFASSWVFTAGYVSLIGGALGRGVVPLDLDSWKRLLRESPPEPARFPALTRLLPTLLTMTAREFFLAGYAQVAPSRSGSAPRRR